MPSGANGSRPAESRAMQPKRRAGDFGCRRLRRSDGLRANSPIYGALPHLGAPLHYSEGCPAGTSAAGQVKWSVSHARRDVDR